MNRTGLIQRITGFVGVATVASFASLPALAQVNPRPTVLTEPNYDGNPATYQAPAATPSLSGVNPRPSILREPNYDGNPATRQANPATPLSQTPAAPTRPVSGEMQASALDREFMIMAAHSDQFEIQSSQLALQKTTNPEVRQYAQRMIQEHTQSSRQLAQLAAQRGVTLPTDPGPFNSAVIAQLTPLSGGEFDRAYLEAQTNGHMQTVAVFQTEIGQGQDQAVQSFASQLLPTIQGHYQMASGMTGQQSALGMPNMPNRMP